MGWVWAALKAGKAKLIDFRPVPGLGPCANWLVDWASNEVILNSVTPLNNFSRPKSRVDSVSGIRFGLSPKAACVELSWAKWIFMWWAEVDCEKMKQKNENVALGEGGERPCGVCGHFKWSLGWLGKSKQFASRRKSEIKIFRKWPLSSHLTPK